MGRKLYLECYDGLNCRKLLQVLLALGAEEKQIEKVLKKISGQGVQFEEIVERAEIKDSIKESLFWVLQAVLGKWEITLEDFQELAAVFAAMDLLGFTDCILAPVTEGFGVCDGEEIPKTDVLSVIEKYQIPIRAVPGGKEKVTLSGALAAARLWSKEKIPSCGYVEKTGRGEGIRAVIFNTESKESTDGEKRDTVQVLETNVDDCSGEQLGYAIECLMKAGALDASCFPIYMKKQRPAYMLQVICKKEKQEVLEDIIFRETTSIGLRRYEENRRILMRTFGEIKLKDGHRVRIKICEHHGQKFCYPEYETVKQVCRETGRPYRHVYDEAAALAGELYDSI